MIKKLWVTAASNKIASIAFAFVSYMLVLTYHAKEWGLVIFFAVPLASYILQLARTSTVYDMMKRDGKI